MNLRPSPRNVTIIVAEQTCVLGTLALAIMLDPAGATGPRLGPQIALATLLYVGAFYTCDLYDFSKLQFRRELFSASLRVFSTLAMVFGIIFLLTSWLTFHSATIFVHLVLTAAFVLLARPPVEALLIRRGLLDRVAIIGTGPEARRLAHDILRRTEYGQHVSCFVGAADADGSIAVRVSPGRVYSIPIIPSSQLAEFAATRRLKRILVSTAEAADAAAFDDLLRCKAQGYEVLDSHRFWERLVGRIFVADLTPQWLLFSEGFTRSAPARFLKRVVDLVSASCVLVLTVPICLLVALVIKLQDGGPVLYRQQRVGRRSVPFELFKFRSMRVDAEAASGPVWAETHDPRVTPIGRVIRMLRIDEIPQAWNVLRGDMSFVGPRPERPEFVAQLRQLVPYYDSRHGVRPGITGWAQVNLPYGASISESRDKLEYDLYYLKNFSVLMDLFILLRTVKIIMFGWGSR